LVEKLSVVGEIGLGIGGGEEGQVFAKSLNYL
jgi:hypothetical protein